MNLQHIERLKGLLARVELNSKKPRQRPAVPAVEVGTPVKAAVTAASTSADEFEVEDVALDDFAVELLPTPSTPISARSAPVFAQPAPVATAPKPVFAPPAPSTPVAVRPSPIAASKPVRVIDTVSAKGKLELEDMSHEEVTQERPLASVSAPIQTNVNASPKPLAAPPEHEELAFSIAPPAGGPAKLPPLEASVAPSERPPVSSRQLISEAPESIDAALIAAAHAEAEGREAPLLTPPPESGKQRARPAAEAASYREVSPTMEQLGDVVALEEMDGPDIELAAVPVIPTKHEPEELEFVPQSVARTQKTADAREAMPTLVGDFTENEETSTRETPPTFVIAATPLTPEVTARKPIATSAPVLNVVAQAQGFRPKSFLELLDASLKLGKH